MVGTGWDELMLPKVWSSKLSAICPAVNRLTTLMSKNMKRKNDEETDNPRKKFVNPNHWANGLLKAMEDDNLRIHADSQTVVIRDKFPKSLYHFLVLPKESIPSLKDINKGHIDLLEHMHSVACQIAQKKEHRDKSFKMGYHAEPSMNHLHMHLISDDFCFVKTKKHYNSYTTSFFIDSESKHLLVEIFMKKYAGSTVVQSGV